MQVDEKETYASCSLKEQCTTSAKGRSVSIHPDKALLIELREHQQTVQGRAQLRERVAVAGSSTICTFWPVLNRFKLRFRKQRDFLTDVLDVEDGSYDEAQG